MKIKLLFTILLGVLIGTLWYHHGIPCGKHEAPSVQIYNEGRWIATYNSVGAASARAIEGDYIRVRGGTYEMRQLDGIPIPKKGGKSFRRIEGR